MDVVDVGRVGGGEDVDFEDFFWGGAVENIEELIVSVGHGLWRDDWGCRRG